MPLSAEYWIDQSENPGQVLLDQAEIAAFNRRLFTTDDHMVDLAVFPDSLLAHELRERIQAVSKPFDFDLYDANGDRLGPEGYSKFRANLGLECISKPVQVQFALVVNRTGMRSYPTNERFFKSPQRKELDRFQENGLFLGDALAVLHLSADEEWCFVLSYNYAAWVRNDHIAIGDRKTIQDYKNANRFLVVTGAMEGTANNPRVPALSMLQLDMGVCIPRAEGETDKGGAGYTVLLPIRDKEGKLEIKQALIDKDKDVSEGFIPFTRENIIRQAFKFLGEHYGWGHSKNARDCTGFVMDIYKTFGIHMPRNSYQQGSGAFGENTRFDSDARFEEKLHAVSQLDVGDLIYVPGHVLMHIGTADGQPHVIHDVSVFRFMDENGEYQEKALNGVMVAPFIGLRESRDATYVDKIYNLKKIR